MGEGYATPLVIESTVYVFTRRGSQETVTALDAATGAERWRAGYAAPYTPSPPTAGHGSGPKATPVFHEGRLFTLGISGIVAAFDTGTETLLWRTEAPDEPPYFSAAASPVAGGTLVITHPGNYGPLTAFDVTTGTVTWTAGGGGFFMSPLIAELSGTRQVISVTQDGIIGVSLPDGQLLWQHEWAGSRAGGTMPIRSGDTIIVSAADSGTIAVRSVKRDDGSWRSETVWETPDISMYLSNPVVVDGTLYGLSTRASGQFFALDVQTGEVLWLGPPRQADNAAVVKAGAVVFFLEDNGELVVTAANRDELRILTRYTVADSPTWAQPAISGTRLFVKDETSLALWTLE